MINKTYAQIEEEKQAQIRANREKKETFEALASAGFTEEEQKTWYNRLTVNGKYRVEPTELHQICANKRTFDRLDREEANNK